MFSSGKTVQLVAFLAGLHYSQALFKANTTSSLASTSPFLLPPTLILAPATIMTQWLREFHTWYPELRVLVLHDSVQAHHGQSKEAVVEKLFTSAHVLITTYECARLYRHLLLHREWGYTVLDEGHKIRNPDAAITLTCKQLLSTHRLILTGAPIQNNLVELWSLFDFIFPGKLGTLPVFEDEFCVAEGTLVTLADGTSVPIEEVQVGAYVLSYYAAGLAVGETEGLTARRVDAVMDRGHRPCVELLFSDKRTLVCTPDHRIRTADSRWVTAGELLVGVDKVAVGDDPDVYRSIDKAAYSVRREAKVLPLFHVRLVSRRHVGLAHVYDLSVPSPQGEDSRSFTANGVIAHNCFPIHQGGYTNASTTQVQAAYRCASVLRDLINPYVLRRQKADVAAHLPKKTEQVLFVNLSPTQRDIYKAFLASEAVQETIDGRGSLFKAIHILRKITNHPDLLELKEAVGAMGQRKVNARKVEPRDMPDYGAVERSGKMQVVEQILQVWHKEGHRVLLFTQTRQMLDIVERFISPLYSYHRIDGMTSIRTRLPLIDSFNSDPSVFLFLLTTKAGGLGVNLTGADRVLLFDPDWNPSTDLQARERSWRIGQRKEVTVYRLIVRGTIEEKIYHRQIFKQFLTKSHPTPHSIPHTPHPP